MKLGIYSKIFLCLLIVVTSFSFAGRASAEVQTSTMLKTGAVLMNSPEAIAVAVASKVASKVAPKISDALGIREGFLSAIREFIGILTVLVIRFWSLVITLTGLIFDGVIKMTLLDLGTREVFGEGNDNNFNGIVVAIWKIFRDIGNIIIIFSLLYLAIKTILEGDGFADKKVLSGILIAAVLINFSLFFTKLAFDVSNTVSVAIYTQIKQGEYAGDGSISTAIVNMLKFPNIIDKLESGGLDWNDLMSMVFQTILFSSLMAILSLIFLAAAFMILYRFFVFIILMILSPIGLVSKFIPWLSGMGSKWWDQLQKQVLALPAFFIALYVALYAASTIFAQFANGSLYNSLGKFDEYSAAKYFINFFLLVMFFGLTLFAPGFVGGAGSEIMSGAGKRLKGFGKSTVDWTKRSTGGAVLGGGAMVARSTLGGGARVLAKNQWLQKQAQKPGMITGGSARKVLGGLDYAGNKATYDARNIKVGGKAIGKEYGIGEGIMGYRAAVEDQKKKIEARKKDEFERLGFKDMKADKNALYLAEGKQTDSRQDFEKKKKKLEEVRRGRANKTTTAKDELDARKDLETSAEQYRDARVALAKLRNIGEEQYAVLVESRANRVHNYVSTKRPAGKKYAEDTRKKWTVDEAQEYRKAVIKLGGTPATPPPPPSTT